MYQTFSTLDLFDVFVAAVQTASTALRLVNGYDFRGKPIIIDYGKRTLPATSKVAGEADADVSGVP